MGERILLLDDDPLIRTVVAERLRKLGHDVDAVGSLTEAHETLRGPTPDLALLDVKLPDGEGTQLLDELPDVPCIVITAHGTVEAAVKALKHGAQDYLEKPFSLERLEATIQVTLEHTRLRREVHALRRQALASGKIVGASPPMRAVMDLVERVAPAGATVLLHGETGTGKGLLAHTIHRMSPRANQPFVTVTCSALPDALMESELFGHEKGAFTGAQARKRGLVETAAEGSLFLDEVGEIPLAVQGKLLRFIEEKAFRRVGGTQDLTVDARIIAATNRNLPHDVAQGLFREDLYYRLSVLPIELPPLRDRSSDIPALAETFLARSNREFSKHLSGFAPETMRLLEAHRWPGNVRELSNVVERAVLLTDRGEISPEALPAELRGDALSNSPADGFAALGPEGIDLEALERHLLREALRRTGGNRTEAGELLGLSRHQVRNRIQKYGGTP